MPWAYDLNFDGQCGHIKKIGSYNYSLLVITIAKFGKHLLQLIATCGMQNMEMVFVVFIRFFKNNSKIESYLYQFHSF